MSTSIPSQPVSPPGIPLKTCLGCGQQIPIVYTVCPYCRYDPTEKKKGSGAAFAFFTTILAGVCWLAAGVELVTSYYYPAGNQRYLVAGLIIQTCGMLSIIVGLLATKRERYWWMIGLSLAGGILGAAIGVALGNVIIAEILLLNIITVIILFFYKEEFISGRK